MADLSLLREKFTIREIDDMDGHDMIALGNRLVIPLEKIKDQLVIRGHSMHMTLRYGAEIIRHLSYIGTIQNVETLMDWEKTWLKLIEKFEAEHAPSTWICIYYHGKIIFQSGHHHMFFDIIEQCEHKNQNSGDNYEQSIVMAQKAFRQMGRNVMIEQESHVGFVVDDGGEEIRFAIILRTAVQKATFIGRMGRNKDLNLPPPREHEAMSLAADYIEGINMAVRSGFMEADINKGEIKHSSNGMKLYKAIQKRVGALSTGISQVERKFTVNYRPEKPDFKTIQQDCRDNAS
jgi:hypothetical protein